MLLHLIIHFPLYWPSVRLREVKDKGKFQTFSSPLRSGGLAYERWSQLEVGLYLFDCHSGSVFHVITTISTRTVSLKGEATISTRTVSLKGLEYLITFTMG